MQALLEDLQDNTELQLKLVALNKLPAAFYSDDEWLLIEALFQLLVNAVGQLQLVFGQRGEVVPVLDAFFEDILVGLHVDGLATGI